MSIITLYGIQKAYAFSLYKKEHSFEDLPGIYVLLFQEESNFSKVFIDETESFKNTVNLIANQNSQYKYTHLAILEEKEQLKRSNIIVDLRSKYSFSCNEETNNILTNNSRHFRMDSL
jgi:hypothetical protein